MGGLGPQTVGLHFLVAGVCPLVGEAGPKANTGSLECGAWDQEIMGLVPAHWLVELCPRVSSWRVLRVSSLVSAHWCVGPSLGPSPVQGHVRGQMSAQWLLRQPVHWGVGLCLYTVAWPEVSQHWCL